MSPSSPTVPSTGLVGSNSPGAMGRAPGLRRRVKNSVKVGYSSMGRSASLASTPYFLAKARITARITGRGAETRQAGAPPPGSRDAAGRAHRAGERVLGQQAQQRVRQLGHGARLSSRPDRGTLLLLALG